MAELAEVMIHGVMTPVIKMETPAAEFDKEKAPDSLIWGVRNCPNGTDEEFLAEINSVYADMDNFSVRNITIGCSVVHPVIGGYTYHVRIYKTTAGYGHIELSSYGAESGVFSYCRRLSGGVWGDFIASLTEFDAAPAGFGLGEVVPRTAPDNDANNCLTSGWWEAAKNTPFNAWSAIHVSAYDASNIYQEAYSVYGASGTPNSIVARRVMQQGTWKPWEYVNPPLIVGVEYRTTMRSGGLPVYQKKIDLGVAVAGVNTVAHGITGITSCLSADFMDGGGTLNGRVTSYNFDSSNVTITVPSGVHGRSFGVVLTYEKAT